MPNSSSTTTANVHDLIDNLATFAEDAGWIVERNTLSGTNRTLTLKRAESAYIHIFNTSQGQLRMRASTGYNGALPPSGQPGVCPEDVVTARMTGPYPKVWFFADGLDVTVVTRRSDENGAYASFAFGVLQKYGAYTGGTYIDGTFFDRGGGNSGRWNSSDHGLLAYGTNGGYVHADADGVVGQWNRIGATSAAGAALVQNGPLEAAGSYNAGQTGPTYSVARLLGAADDNVFSGRSMLYPIEVMIRRAGTPAYFSPVGVVGSVRAISLAKFAPEEELAIASETWTVFPIVRKRAQSGGVNDPHSSGDVGFAVRKTP